MSNSLVEKAKIAKEISYKIAASSLELRNNILLRIADALERSFEDILRANRIDLENGKAKEISSSLYKRLELSKEKIFSISEGVRSVAALDDPLGKISLARELDKDLILKQVSVPIGVLGVIFESRPDALVQIASLCIKSANCVILKGGSEAINTNKALYQIIVDEAAALSGDFAASILFAQSREDIKDILSLDDYIDLLIPRGSNELVKFIKDNTKIPVLGHADGICHMYIDSDIDLESAVDLAVDSKLQYPAVCNAIETLLVNQSVAAEFLPYFAKKVAGKLEIRGDERVSSIISCERASDADWATEYNDYIVSIKIVSDIYEAVNHINFFGSHHSDAIVTNDESRIDFFQKNVDSSSVMVNCSTRFADGFRYGFGAEVGISTNKIHARGPVGLDGLTTTKYLLSGKGHIVAPYADGKVKFTHRDI
ncbi:MAG: glutamate-5-semialdehyde dehydrogenase [Spirochaetales bacterium]|nr:glutamate-5-semialdehyde dehydrogenase [Spirochaetales bacterium]